MASEEEPIYCLCRLPYDETRFMIECDVCKDWFHGSCVGVQEHQAADIEIYHCPNCTPKHGPLSLKRRRNWHRHDYSEDGSNLNTAVQTGTVVFIKELKKRAFPSADEIPIKRLHGSQITPQYLEEEGFDVPILCEKKDGLNLTMPPPSFSIHDVEQLVGPMREIDVIDVARQEDIKMIMREWTEYYNSPNREKIFNVISLEFSNTRLSEHVSPPSLIRQVSWARNVWPEQLPEDSNLAQPEVQKYCLMGVKDSFTDFHIDFGGTSVWYHVLRGEKVFYLIQPTQTNLMLYERWLSSSNQSEMFFGDQVDECFRMVVKQGHTLFIPTGWIHAVFTPIDSLVFGGNFLHNFNVPLQLQCYEIERQVKTPEKFLFPSYETMNWYAAKHILDLIQDYTEENKSPPIWLVAGAKALATSLKSWTQRKDLTSKYVFAQVGKQDAADYIQYGKLLKDLVKEVKKVDVMTKPSPKKTDNKRKKGEKSLPAAKKVKGLDVLDMHTKETLKTAERERRENIYNFEDEEDDLPVSLKVRIPKAGAYVADNGVQETKKKQIKLEKTDENKAPTKSKIKDEFQPTNRKGAQSKKVKTIAKEKTPEALDCVVPEENIGSEEVVKTEKDGESSPVKEIPQCLKFKLSNGKMISTDRKPKKSKKQKKGIPLNEGGTLSNSIKKDPTTKEVKIENSEDDETKIKANVSKKKKSKPSEDEKKKSKVSEDDKKEKTKISEDDKKKSKVSADDKKNKKFNEGDRKKLKDSENDKQKKKVSETDKKSTVNEDKRKKSKADGEKIKIKSEEASKTKGKSKSLKQKDSSQSGKSKKKVPETEDGIQTQVETSKGSKDGKRKKEVETDTRKSKVSRQNEKKNKSEGVKDKKKKASEKYSTKSAVKDVGVSYFNDSDKDSDSEQLVVDENPKKKRVQKTTSTTKPATLKLKLLSGSLKMKSPADGSEQTADGEDQSQSMSEMSSRLDLDTIRGGLNGSISDILTASGYGTETAFRVDNESSGMRDAIAGMLTMSRMGEDGDEATGSLFSSRNQSRTSVAEEEEEQLMADCYRDGEFVYPSFELSEDEDDAAQKSKRKTEKDDNWNPKARVDPMYKSDREQRVGVQKQSMTTNLATTAAKLTENPPNEKKQGKKPQKLKSPEPREFEVEPLAGPSTAPDDDDDDDTPVNAFRPGIKRPLDPCASLLSQSPKAKKPKKGLATAKQRLGKLLKIKKMVF